MKSGKSLFKAWRANKGFAIVVTLLALSLICIIGFGMISLSTLQSRTISNQLQAKKAYNYARCGVQRAAAELKSDYSWSSVTEIENSEGYTVTVEEVGPDNANSPNKLWKIKSTGQCGDAKRTFEAWLGMETFALYALFFDQDKDVWFTNEDKQGGRVHTNTKLGLYGCPRFSGRCTSSNVGDSYYDSSNFRYNMKSGHYTDDPSKFYRRYNTNTAQYGYDTQYIRPFRNSVDYSFAGGQPSVPLPTYTDADLYGSSTPTYFTWVESKAGDYVFSKDVYLTFHDNGSGSNGTVDIKDSSGNLITTNKNGDPVTNPADTTNLTIKVNGDVYIGYPRDGVAEKMKGRTTIVAAKRSGSYGNVKIKDSIIYDNIDADVLGLVAESNLKIETSGTEKGYIKDEDGNSILGLRIDASIMALNGTVSVKDATSGTRRGDLLIWGGVVRSYRAATENSSCTTGYGTRFSYDPKLYLKPPVNWPLTGSVRVKSLNDFGALK